jgi:site-specific DNA-methyltransferase (adenine-specific)
MVELLNCDCMEYMATLPDKAFDLAVVDPPYENKDAIGISNGKGHAANRKDYHLFKNTMPPPEYFLELKRVSKNQIVWGGNYFGLRGGAIVWNKEGTAFGEGEIAICSTHHSVRFFRYIWNGMIQQDMKNKEFRIHPTQKPVALYDWILRNYAKPGQRILDTHLGSGSSAIAAHYFGCDFVGCEIDVDYFNAAKERFDRETRQVAMF